ncbi:MAG: hypothetical protein VZR28_09120 [Candidatus Cryptobacteroides sp.]|nr:hypothetical protein [Candidatus Cryptobacteroides sp.]
MSEAITTTTVLLAGSREAIIGILNRAFRVCSGGYKIADDDSIETINGKINAANEHMAGYRTAFTLMDYLDLQSRMDSPFKDYVLSYIDEENPDGSENYDANPVEVSADGDGYTLKIVTRVREGQRTYYPEDWHYWCAMLSVSDGCLISFNKGSE